MDIKQQQQQTELNVYFSNGTGVDKYLSNSIRNQSTYAA